MSSPEDKEAPRPTSVTEKTLGETVMEALPIPTNTEVVTDPNKVDIAQHVTEEPTLSHSLAIDDHDEKGASQQDHDTEEVVNLGWNEPKQNIIAPLVGGMDNEELWLLIRRFNKVWAFPVRLGARFTR